MDDNELKENQIPRFLHKHEKNKGYINISNEYANLFPDKSGNIKIIYQDIVIEPRYNVDYGQIYGLKKGLFNKVKEFDESEEGPSVIIEKRSDGYNYTIRIEDQYYLSNSKKGNIVEDVIKNLILLHGDDILNVYKPVVDDGIDLVVIKNNPYLPIFIQVKSCFVKLTEGSVKVTLNRNTFRVHPNYYVLIAYFDANTREIEDNILFIPSTYIGENSELFKNPNQTKFSITSKLSYNPKNKWQRFSINKSGLVSKIFEIYYDLSNIES